MALPVWLCATVPLYEVPCAVKRVAKGSEMVAKTVGYRVQALLHQ